LQLAEGLGDAGGDGPSFVFGKAFVGEMFQDLVAESLCALTLVADESLFPTYAARA
jgi:hypothetical protein